MCIRHSVMIGEMIMTKTETAYIAGIIDGEGSISLIRQSCNQHHSPVVSVASTDLELLEWLLSTIGSGTVIKKKNYNPSKHKDSYTYTIIRHAAIQLLEDIVPYLIINKKRLRAEHIINNYRSVTLRNGRYNSEQLEAKSKFYDDFIAI